MSPCQSSTCGLYLTLEPPLEIALVVSIGFYLVLEPPRALVLTACEGETVPDPGTDPEPGDFD